jgi:hypothetical protein
MLSGAVLGCAGSGVTGLVERRGVGWVARGRTGGVDRAGACEVCRLGAWGSVGRLDCWVQMMNLCSITLGDE